MKSKDKKRKKFIITFKDLIVFVSIVLAIIYGMIFYSYYFLKSEVYASNVIEKNIQVEMSNASKIDIDSIIKNNMMQGQKEEIIIEEQEFEYITKYQKNSEVPKGKFQVLQEGRNGKQEIIKKRIYEDEEMIKEENLRTRIIKGPVNKIIEVGTGRYAMDSNVLIGEEIYTTSYQSSIREEPNERAVKVATLPINTKMIIIGIDNDWYKVKFNGSIGFVKKENTTTINRKYKKEDNDYGIIKGNIQKIDFNMELNKPSGLTIEQFKEVLTDQKDKNKIFEQNAQFFYYIEQQYNINGIFVAAVGIHESAWGTSKIAVEKHNLFGYGAYDSNPYNGAYQFLEYSESIDLIARVFVKYYLNSKGTQIYGTEKAVGTYFNGATLSGINKRYASDKNWASIVFNHMKYLYNKL